MPDDFPAGGPPRHRLGRPVLLAGTALLAVAAGAGIALAATTGSSAPLSAPRSLSAAAATPSPAPSAVRPRCVRVTTPRRSGVLCARPGLGGVLHGTFVLPKPGGGTVTVEIQSGSVTAVSPSAITLKSSDGFTKTYAVSASTIVVAERDGIGSVKVGDQVQVAATASGGKVTAIRVRDLTQLKTEGAAGWPGPWSRSPAGHPPGPGSGGSGGSAASFFGGPAGG